MQTEYICTTSLNLYKTPDLQGLVTQAATGRHVRLLPFPAENGGKEASQGHYVQLCEDDYPGWLAAQNLSALKPADVA